jgi:hypothetical protein
VPASETAGAGTPAGLRSALCRTIRSIHSLPGVVDTAQGRAVAYKQRMKGKGPMHHRYPFEGRREGVPRGGIGGLCSEDY